MNFDWVVGIVTFLVLVVFSFNYYTAFFVYRADLGIAAPMINERVLHSLKTEAWSVPVYYNSTGPQPGKVLYADMSWPQGTKESAKILLNGIEQPCVFVGDRLYWQSNVANGDNMFQLAFSNISAPMNCNDPITIAGESQAVPWSMETREALSQGKLDVIAATEYGRYLNSISVSRDLRLEVDGFSYGPLPPKSVDVYVFEKNSTIAETGQTVLVRVLVW